MAHSGKKHWQFRLAFSLIFVPLFVSGNICCNRSKSFHGYDGTWWANTPLDQKLGFIDGFVDCYTYGCRKESKLCATRNDLETGISLYYAKNGNDISILVGEALIRVAKSKGAFSSEGRESSKPAQETEAFDGLAWLKYSPKKRMGFVEGYLNALMPQTSRSAMFPQNPEYYSNAVTRFYRVSPAGQAQTDTSGYPLKRKIGDVLWNMRNQSR